MPCGVSCVSCWNTKSRLTRETESQIMHVQTVLCGCGFATPFWLAHLMDLQAVSPGPHACPSHCHVLVFKLEIQSFCQPFLLFLLRIYKLSHKSMQISNLIAFLPTKLWSVIHPWQLYITQGDSPCLFSDWILSQNCPQHILSVTICCSPRAGLPEKENVRLLHFLLHCDLASCVRSICSLVPVETSQCPHISSLPSHTPKALVSFSLLIFFFLFRQTLLLLKNSREQWLHVLGTFWIRPNKPSFISWNCLYKAVSHTYARLTECILIQRTVFRQTELQS